MTMTHDDKRADALTEGGQDLDKLSALTVAGAHESIGPAASGDSTAWVQYVVLPVVFLLVALLGGFRLSAEGGEFLFLRPSLIWLIFAAMALLLLARSGLLRIDAWFSRDFSPLRNSAHAGVAAALFAASVQVFNALLPEQGAAFWIVGFFFFWSLWTNLFADLAPAKLLTSLGGLFALAFITKYIVIAELASGAGEGFVRALFSGNLTRETIVYLLGLPRFSGGTGYIQFFTIVLFLAGLYMLPPAPPEPPKISSSAGVSEITS
jgi:hypothetical protein